MNKWLYKILIGLLMVAQISQHSTGGPARSTRSVLPSWHQKDVVPGVVMVKFTQGVRVLEDSVMTNSPSLSWLLRNVGITKLDRLEGVSRIYYARISSDSNPMVVARQLEISSEVEFAEPKLYQLTLDVPNDPLVPIQTALFTRMNAFDGWTRAKGDSSVTIATVDGGTHWRHEDLYYNLWVNSPEDVNRNGRFDQGPPPVGDEDGIDQDGNGRTDDVIGWNFASNSNNPRGLSSTPSNAEHGTNTASMFGARTNNSIGMAGSSWNCRLMPICASANTDQLIAFGYEGIIYAYTKGAKVINCSWGRTGGYSRFEQEVVDAATEAGALVVCAAGNGTNNNGTGKNNDAMPDYPAGYRNVLAVGATNSTSDGRAGFSNYGRTVPVYAPGVSILGATNGGGYNQSFMDGTSFSSPLVAGLAGIVKSQHPTWTPRQVALQIKTTCDSIDGANPSLAGNLGRGRVNFARALSESHAGIEITNAVLRTPSGRNLFLQNDTIVMTLTVQNILFAAANNLTFTATSSDAAVTVLQGTSSGGNLASGQSITLPAMTFRVGALTAARDVVLRLNWVSNTNDRDSWAYKITVFPSTPSWETQASPTTSILYSVKAVNRSVVWACGGTSPASVVIRTTNGGIAWTDATGNLTGQDLYCIFATDANRAWVGTGSGRIYGTADGGTTWTQQVYPGTQSPFINAIWMFPNGTGYAQGDPPGTGRFVVLKTTNFGATWAHTTSEPVGIASEAGWNNSLAMTDENRMWFGTNNSRVWRTTDGGVTWSSAASGSASSYAIAFKDNNSGIVGHATGTVRITVNGGATWTTAATPTASAISGLAYLTGTNLAWAAVGASPYRTSNNATSWSAQTVFPISGTLNHISFVDSTAGWAVTSNGEILRYPTTTTSVQRSEEMPEEFSLEQNFPNPFNPTTQIKFNIHNVGTEHVQPVQLKVFDLLGREVATLVNEPLQAGGYTIQFDGSLLASGVYIYRLRAGSLAQERRMLLIK